MNAFSPPRTIRVLIVDDHALVREGLKALLMGQADMDVCGEAESAAQAMALIKQTLPHVAVVDLTLKDGNGLQLIKDIASRHGEVRVVVSSMHEEMVYAERALQAGAMAYVHKEESSHRILDAIRCVIEDRVFVSDQVASRLLTQAARRPNAVGRSGIDLLTDRELQVFEMIGGGLTTRKIAEKLHLSPKTVDTHRQKIREKLNLGDAAALTHFATQWALDHQ
jgi:DNA-binding NarL/FixJ family response regulator